VGILAVKALLISVNPRTVSAFSVNAPICQTYIVFQLNLPEYRIERRCGSLVKSTLLIRESSPVKNSSKGGVSGESVTKTSPLAVKWLRIWIVYSSDKLAATIAETD
jgi:hypothetical protein